jgi:hypothetical protein
MEITQDLIINCREIMSDGKLKFRVCVTDPQSLRFVELENSSREVACLRATQALSMLLRAPPQKHSSGNNLKKKQKPRRVCHA